MAFRILLPLDGTPVSLQQARFAIQLVLAGLQAEILVTNIQEPANFYEVLRAGDPDILRELASRTGQELVAPACGLLEAAGVTHEIALVEDTNTVQGLLELVQLQDCRMVIVGLHDPTLLQRAGMLATGERLARISPAPVVSVRKPRPEAEPEA